MAGGWEGYGCGGGRLEKNWDNVKQESRGGNGTIRHSELLTGRLLPGSRCLPQQAFVQGRTPKEGEQALCKEGEGESGNSEKVS